MNVPTERRCKAVAWHAVNPSRPSDTPVRQPERQLRPKQLLELSPNQTPVQSVRWMVADATFLKDRLGHSQMPDKG